MSKIYIFGSGAGTEPIKGTHHTAWALEVNSKIYWFDAGEECAYTAMSMGIDFSKIAGIFISHMHIDHTAGLFGLMHTIMKRASMYDEEPLDNTIKLYLPEKDAWKPLETLTDMMGMKAFPTEVKASYIADGLIFADENIKIYALHNRHLQKEEGDGWKSYSFLIETKEKRIVYSGDVSSPEELDPLFDAPVDMLLIETGHHKLDMICDYVNARKINGCVFVHNGRAILNDYNGSLAFVKENMKCPAEISKDQTVIEL
ncbi:MAG: MBL fold metallo-hydrolase [Clostridia bacterium]|nr:MBL fold metallo-hydrolase [Clostridia bacterium]